MAVTRDVNHLSTIAQQGSLSEGVIHHKLSEEYDSVVARWREAIPNPKTQPTFEVMQYDGTRLRVRTDSVIGVEETVKGR